MGCKLKQGPKGQANLGGSAGMVPWKILKFEVAKDVISCTLIIKFDSKFSAPFKHYFLDEDSQFVSLNLFLYECKF